MNKPDDLLGTPEFLAWFRDSKIVDANGAPLPVYKAMFGDSPYINQHTAMTHVAISKAVAESFSGEGRRVHKVYVNSRKPFDFRNKEDLSWLVAEMTTPRSVAEFNRQTIEIMGHGYSHEVDARELMGALEDGAYQAYEVPIVFNAIKERGYDAIYMLEELQNRELPNLAVFSPSQIKIAVGQERDNDKSDRVAQLQKQLAASEAKFEPLRKRKIREGPQWDAVAEEARQIRVQLFDLTGDAYGKVKTKLVRPSDEALEAAYASPDEVPADVRRWVQQNTSILYSDATDAVRWGRITDTLRDERYPSGDLTIYRAVANGDGIRPGDWVATELEYAEGHLRKSLGGRGRILEEAVDGRDVLASPTGNAEEAIYAPRSLSGPVQTKVAERKLEKRSMPPKKAKTKSPSP